MSRKERFVNDAETTLNGSITSSATSITVIDGTVFPSEGDFRILIDDEIIFVTARATHVLTVARGQESTTGEAHAANSFVRAIVTAGALDQRDDDSMAGTSDRIAHRMLDDSGAVLTATDFSWINQGAATVADDPWGGITMTCPGVTGTNLRILERTAISTPWTLTAHVVVGAGFRNACQVGICVRETASSKIITTALRPDGSDTFGGTVVFRYDSPTVITTPTSTLGSAGKWHAPFGWVQIEDNGTTLYYRFSQDGINWWTRHSHARGTHFTVGPNRFGLVANTNATGDTQYAHWTAWLEE